MPGQFTRRGGILDVYSPEIGPPRAHRVLRRRDRIHPQLRSRDAALAVRLDEALLLPLTETPVTEQLLAAVNARLSRSASQALEGDEAPTELKNWPSKPPPPAASASSPAGSSSPPWPAPTATLLDLLPQRACSSSKSPPWCRTRATAGGTRSSSATSAPASARSSGRKTSISRPGICKDCSQSHPGLDLDQLGAVDVLDEDSNARRRSPSTRGPRCASTAPSPRFIEQLEVLMAAGARASCSPRPIRAKSSGSPPCCASTRSPTASAAAHAAHRQRNHLRRSPATWPATCACPSSCAPPIATGVSFPDAQPRRLRRQRSFRRRRRRRAPRAQAKSKTAAFVSDFRDLAVGDYVVHVEHGIAQLPGPEGDRAGRPRRRIHDPRVRRAGQALRPAHAPRPDPEVPLHRHRPRAGLNKLGSQQWAEDQGPRQEGHGRTWPPSCSSSTPQRHAARARPSRRTTTSSASSKTPSTSTRPTTSSPPSPTSSSDMESTTPMDRLLCGDVGYGKTEVAMRAAFKAVQDGKQVAVLTPTTVLASSTSRPSSAASRNSPSTSR